MGKYETQSLCRETTMPPKPELSQGQIEEIQALWGQLSAAEAKKRFDIGSTRLYKIWRDESGVAEQQPADPAQKTSCNNRPLPPQSKTSTEGWRGSSLEQSTLWDCWWRYWPSWCTTTSWRRNATSWRRNAKRRRRQRPGWTSKKSSKWGKRPKSGHTFPLPQYSSGKSLGQPGSDTHQSTTYKNMLPRPLLQKLRTPRIPTTWSSQARYGNWT